jgi:hypothetical protein
MKKYILCISDYSFIAYTHWYYNSIKKVSFTIVNYNNFLYLIFFLRFDLANKSIWDSIQKFISQLLGVLGLPVAYA